MKFRKKPVVIEAIQWTGDNFEKIKEFSASGIISHLNDHNDNRIAITTLEGIMIGSKGDWIIKGVKDEIYPCRADIFEATYEPVEDE